MTGPAPKPALGRNAEIREMAFGRCHPAACAFDAIRVMQQPEVDFLNARTIKPAEWREIGVIVTLARYRHVQIVDRPVKSLRNGVGELDTRAEIARVERVLVILAPVAEVKS